MTDKGKSEIEQAGEIRADQTGRRDRTSKRHKAEGGRDKGKSVGEIRADRNEKGRGQTKKEHADRRHMGKTK